MVNLVFLGPPGAGKGTYAKELVKKLNIPHISTGDMFRETAASGTELGNKIKEIMERGDLVPDELVNQMVKERLKRDDCSSGFILDGYPRTVEQAKALDEMLKELGRELTWAIFFDVPEEVVVRRLTNRRICPKCGRIYNLLTMPPKEDNLCDVCKVPLVQREDDREEVVRRRYRVYMEKTFPVVEYYGKTGKLQKLDGTVGLERVIEEVLKLVK
ncbi:MAG: adenylate kinase [Thermotogaceae bacterium]|nr:adenylate kinase [Thermotogaceae bacterium]